MNLKKLSDADYKKMAKEVSDYRANVKMTDKERLAGDISGYSALPLITMFVYWPVGACLGAVIGAGAAIVTGGAFLPGLFMGLAGGSIAGWGAGIGQAVIGMKIAKNADKNFKKRIEKDVINIQKRYLKPYKKFDFSIAALFNKFSGNKPKPNIDKMDNNLDPKNIQKKQKQNKPK